MILLIIYLLGVIATAVLLFYSLEKGCKVTVGDLIPGFLICLISWVGFISIILICFSDHVIFTKK